MTPAATRALENIRAVLRNAFALLGAYALPRVLTLGAVIFAARAVGAEQFGAYGTAAGLAVIASVVATLGMMPLLTRDIARDPTRARELLSAAHWIKSASNIVMLLTLGVVAGWLLDYPTEVRNCAFLLGAAYAIGAYAENYAAYYQAIERMHVWTQASACFGLVTGGLGALFAFQTRSIVLFSAAPLAGQMVSLAYLRWKLPPLPEARTSATAMYGLLRGLAPFAAGFIALTIYSKIDVLILNETANAIEVGFYTAAYKFVDIAQALSVVAAAAVYPRLARAAPQSHGDRWAGARLIELMLIATTVVAAALWLLRGPAILLLFGEEYSASSTSLAFLAAALPALVLNIAACYVLAARDSMRSVAIAYAGIATVSIGLNLLLTSRFAAVGAAASKLVSETVLAGVLLILLHRSASAAPSRGIVLRLALLPVCCAGLSLLPDPTGGWIRAGALVATAVLLFAGSGALRSHELIALRHLVGRKTFGFEASAP